MIQPLRHAPLLFAIACAQAPSAPAPEFGAGTDDDAGTTEDAGVVPAFEGTQEPIPDDVRADMTGKSWRAGCPVGLDDLALLHLAYVDFDGQRQVGELVVAADVADTVIEIFRQLYVARFPIERMDRVDAYDASDAASMHSNNTSAFNCRFIAGTTKYSLHSYGTAIDLNPRQNPWNKGAVFDPPEGSAFGVRTDVRPGMITADGPVKAAFDAAGWGWGGTWTSYRDFMHFSREGW